MKKKIVNISMIVILLLLSFMNTCRAFIIDDDERVRIVWDDKVPYYYQGEEKEKYCILTYKDVPIYTVNKENSTIYSIITNTQDNQNKQLQKVFENGYPNKTYQELGCINMIEAYLATQEAIYLILENKDINLYVAEDEIRTKNIRWSKTNIRCI